MSSKVFCLVLLIMVSMSGTVMSSQLTNITTNQSLVTVFQGEHLSYEWTIENFTMLPEETKCHNSSLFRSKLHEVGWKLSFCPKLADSAYYASVDLYPSGLADSEKNFRIDGEFSIMKSGHLINNQTFRSKLMSQEKCTHNPYRGYECVENHYNVRLSQLLGSSNSNDNITIRLEIDMPLKRITKIASDEHKKVPEPQKGKINEDFGRLLKQEKFSDVEIIVGNQSLSAHEIVLATRSPVFADLFELIERNDTGKLRVIIENIEPAVVQAMLEYIYTDDVSNLDELPLTYGLLAAADEFKLPYLKGMCEIVLDKKLDADNAADILVLTDRYGLNKLKKHAMEFIRNHFPDVMETEGYKKMKDKSPALLMEILFSATDKRF